MDVSDPTNPTLISDIDTRFISRNVTLNGSGLAIVSSQTQGIGVYDVTNPEDTDALLFEIDTPGSSYDVAIASGIAYVADLNEGLQVINYRNFDNQGVAPTVTISTSADLDPNTEGMQVLEGTSVPIQVDVTDDVQVRNVELLVNEEVVGNDVSFPFELSAIALSEQPEDTTATVQVRATDTGGNSSLSNLLTLDLLPDTFAPEIVSITPAEGEAAEVGSIRRITVNFNEGLDAATVTASNFQLINDRDEIITPLNIQLRSDDQIVQLTYDSLPIGDYRLVIQAEQVSDRAGNILGETDVVSNFLITLRELNLSDLDGSNGFVINGIDVYDQSGFSVSTAGDVNGDGFADLIIGASVADPNSNIGAGESYVVFGKAGGFAAQLNLSELDGTNGFILNGIDRFDQSGRSVSTAGDVNGDGFDDLIIGAPEADPNASYDSSSGESYVVFGKAGEFSAELNLSDLDGTNGFILNGIDSGDMSGYSVSTAGDVNGDGFADLIIGAKYADPNGNSGAGESYVVFGNPNFGN